MTTLTLEDETLVETLEELAKAENRPLTDLLWQMFKVYTSESTSPTPQEREEALRAMAGMFDDDVTDLSETVRETMDAYYRKKYGDSD